MYAVELTAVELTVACFLCLSCSCCPGTRFRSSRVYYRHHVILARKNRPISTFGRSLLWFGHGVVSFELLNQFVLVRTSIDKLLWQPEATGLGRTTSYSSISKKFINQPSVSTYLSSTLRHSRAHGTRMGGDNKYTSWDQPPRDLLHRPRARKRSQQILPRSRSQLPSCNRLPRQSLVFSARCNVPAHII